MSSEPVPVEPCNGWTSSCPFCDKRFADWKQTDNDEVLQKIPDQPLAFMFGLESKQGKETVIIGIATTDSLQKITKKLNFLRQQISQRKSRDMKSNILLRWMNLPQIEAKDACSIFAHWNNYGILPRFSTEWPGINILEKADHFHLSSLTGKWCHNTKEAVWRKTKAGLMPKAVKKCKWTEKCAFCDSRFTPWRSLSECKEKKLAPDTPGFIMFAAKHGDKHKVYNVESNKSIGQTILNSSYVEYVINSEEKSKSGNDGILVRWMIHEDIEDNDSCFIYAHWYNADEKPLMNINKWNKYATNFGETVLVKNSKFSYRSSDKQWCYEGDSKPKTTKYSKNKDRRFVQQSIEDELVVTES